MSLQNFIKIFQMGKFHCFQNLILGITSTNHKCHLTILWAISFQYQCVCKISSQYSTQFKSQGYFHFFFRIWISAKPQPMKNVFSQSLGLDLVNINVYAKVYQNIPLSSRDIVELLMYSRGHFAIYQNVCYD